jgi:hypothetical protein
MGRFAAGWQLGVRSWSLLMRDKELIALPLLSGFFSLLALAVFAGPGIALSHGARHPGPVSWVLYAIALFAVSVVATFFGSAVVAGALERLGGGDPTLSSALGAAWTRRGVIVQWAVLATVVGLVVRAIERRAGLVGRLVGTVLDVAWNVASAFALPVLVVEGLTPGKALHRSSDLVRQRWGATAGSFVAVGLVLLPAWLAAIVLGVFVAMLAGPVAGIVVFVVAAVLVAAVGAALSGVSRAALYQFATTGTSPLLDTGLAFAVFRPGRRR